MAVIVVLINRFAVAETFTGWASTRFSSWENVNFQKLPWSIFSGTYNFVRFAKDLKPIHPARFWS